MRYPIYFLTLTLCLAAKSQTPQESKWNNLFNGKDLGGWYADIPAMDPDTGAISPFFVQKNILVTRGEPRGHLISEQSYNNYQLKVSYRFPAKPGNCGVLVHASTPRALYSMFPKSIEVQMMHENAGDFWCIVEDIEVPDMEARRGPREEWGIVEGKKRRIENLIDGAENELGQWNDMLIECREDTIKVWVNDQLINVGYNSTASKGKIAIQSEGAQVEFREITIKSLLE